MTRRRPPPSRATPWTRVYRVRLAPRARDADPPARRLRPGRGGAARRRSRRRSSSGRATACPPIPRAWLVSTGRFKAIDAHPPARPLRRLAGGARRRLEALRRRRRGRRATTSVDDDRLRLIFTCCHPALAPDAQIALTLREVCGLTTEEIARAFLTSAHDPRAAHRPRQGEDPRRADPVRGAVARRLPDRLDAVLHVVYLVFNEGYAASSGASLTRHDLSGEAIRLARLLVRAAAASRKPSACWR